MIVGYSRLFVPASISYQASYEDQTSQTTYTFASSAFGTANASRRVIIGISSAIVGSATISSVTIGGVSATISVQATQGTRAVTGIAIASVPTGTTGSVVITFSNAMLRCAIGVWATYDLQSNTATATTSSVANPLALSLNVLAGGVALGCLYDNNVGAGVVWTGFTERYDFGAQGRYSGADYTASAAQTPLSVTATATAAADTGGVAAAFR